MSTSCANGWCADVCKVEGGEAWLAKEGCGREQQTRCIGCRWWWRKACEVWRGGVMLASFNQLEVVECGGDSGMRCEGRVVSGSGVSGSLHNCRNPSPAEAARARRGAEGLTSSCWSTASRQRGDRGPQCVPRVRPETHRRQCSVECGWFMCLNGGRRWQLGVKV